MTSDIGDRPHALVLPDAHAVADLRTFVTRARAAEDGAIRLQAVGAILAAYVCVLKPAFFGEGGPTVLGMRAMALTDPLDLDITVSLSSVADRLARMDADATEVALPTVTVAEAWTGIAAPKSGWESVAELAVEDLLAAARSGIAEMAALLPDQPGALVVNSARAEVWGRPLEGASVGLPSAAAFAALTLGFLESGSTATVLRNGRWLRLSTGTGHVLVRSPATL